jgi:hypothetical protein
MYVRRAPFVLALALAALAPAPAPAAPPAGRSSGGGPSSLGLLLGLEDGDGDAGLPIRGDLEFAQRPIAPMLSLSIVGSLGYTRHSDGGGYYDPYFGDDYRWEVSAGILKVVPAARFTFDATPRFRPYADAGIGLYYATWTTGEAAYVGYPYYTYVWQEADGDDLGVMLRFAAGFHYEVSPVFSVGGELGFAPYLGDYPDDTLFSVLAAAKFRL